MRRVKGFAVDKSVIDGPWGEGNTEILELDETESRMTPCWEEGAIWG
jgi:hypothetical protein